MKNITRKACSPRSGFSLFEVLLSLGIFMAAFVALSTLSTSGMNAAVESRQTTKAILRCESKMAEIVAAVEPLEDVSDTPFEDDEDWTWSLQTADGPHIDIRHITLTVKYSGDSQLAGTSFVMTRLIRDPAVYEAAAMDAAMADSEEEDF